MAFDWKNFMNTENKIAVHCKTEEEAKDFCKQMHEHGLTWCRSDESYLERDNWYEYKEETCYTSYGSYCSYDFYEIRNYTILEWSDYMGTFTKADLKTGMIVTLRDGDEYFVFVDAVSNWLGRSEGNHHIILHTTKKIWNKLEYYTDDLLHGVEFNDKDFDIMKVELPSHPYAFVDAEYERNKRILLWERKEEEPAMEITMEELEKHFGCKVKIVTEEN